MGRRCNGTSLLGSTGQFFDRHFKVISIIPMLLLISIIIVYPIIYLVKLSFTDTNNMNLLAGTARFVGLRNFVRNFRDKAFMTSMWNTLYFTVVSVGLSTIFGIIVAYLVYSMKAVQKNIMLTCILLPSLIAETACGLMFKPMLNTTIGIFNYFFTSAGFTAFNFLGDKTLAQWMIILLNVWQWTPYMFIFALSGMEGLSSSYFEVARLEGASSLQTLWHVVLPLTRPIILAAMFFRITNALRLFDKVYVLTGGGPGFATDTITSYIQRVGIQRMEFGYGSASGIIMLLFTAIIGAVAMKLMYDTNV
jgi:multiple sugar transport system permease protein